MIHIAVVEDESKELEQISAFIRQFSIEQQVEIKITAFSDGLGIISPYRGDYDVVMLDIQMRYMNGLTAAQKIREKDADVIIIFITNLAQYAIKGYAVRATNFLLKPLTYFAFSEEMKNILIKLSKRELRTIRVSNEDGITVIDIADIVFVESVGRVLKLHTRHGDFRINDTLANVEEQLHDSRFFRCHRGYLVNLYHVERVRNNDILIGDSVIPISRYKRDEFNEALIKTMGERF